MILLYREKHIEIYRKNNSLKKHATGEMTSNDNQK